jgi:hypothetical protein
VNSETSDDAVNSKASGQLDKGDSASSGNHNSGSAPSGAGKNTGTSITVTANGEQYTLTGKDSYVYVDVFDKLDFDLSNPMGRSIVTLLNGKDAKYMENLKDGDVIEIRWEDRK